MTQSESSGPKNTFGQHIPASEDDSPQLLNQTAAIIVGFIVSIFGFLLLLWSLKQLIDVVIQLLVLTGALWSAAATVQFFVAESWRNGLTRTELVYALIWPLDVIRSIRQGAAAMAGKLPGNAHKKDDEGEKILDQDAALWFGGGMILLTIFLLVFGVFIALNILGSAIWLAAIAWVLGSLTDFWVGRRWEDGLTLRELLTSVAWPVSMFRTVRAYAESRRSAQ